MEQNQITKKWLNKTINGKFPLKIIALLEKRKHQTVNKIGEFVGLDQSTTSLILSRFKILKMVNCQVDGKYRKYSLNKERYNEILKAYTQIEINEREIIDSLFTTHDTKEKDPLVYKQKSPILTN